MRQCRGLTYRDTALCGDVRLGLRAAPPRTGARDGVLLTGLRAVEEHREHPRYRPNERSQAVGGDRDDERQTAEEAELEAVEHEVDHRVEPGQVHVEVLLLDSLVAVVCGDGPPEVLTDDLVGAAGEDAGVVRGVRLVAVLDPVALLDHAELAQVVDPQPVQPVADLDLPDVAQRRADEPQDREEPVDAHVHAVATLVGHVPGVRHGCDTEQPERVAEPQPSVLLSPGAEPVYLDRGQALLGELCVLLGVDALGSAVPPPVDDLRKPAPAAADAGQQEDGGAEAEVPHAPQLVEPVEVKQSTHGLSPSFS